MNNVNIFDFPYNNLYSMRNIFIEVGNYEKKLQYLKYLTICKQY